MFVLLWKKQMAGTRGGGDMPGAYSTPTEWKLWNQTRLSQSQLERLTAERLVAESKRLRDDVGNRVTTSRREVYFPLYRQHLINC